MKFKTKRIILMILAGIVVAIIAFFADRIDESPVVLGILAAIFVAYIVLCLIWFRCPHCNTYLRKISVFATHCPFCGKKFDEE